MADFALYQGVVFIIQQGEGAAFAGDQCEVLFQQGFRHFQLEDADFLSAPAIAAQAEQWGSHFASGFWLEFAGDELSDDREALRFGDDVQAQVVHHLAGDRA
ncbi:hypothetical protein D3C76_773280 [compost metagenome]